MSLLLTLASCGGASPRPDTANSQQPDKASEYSAFKEDLKIRYEKSREEHCQVQEVDSSRASTQESFSIFRDSDYLRIWAESGVAQKFHLRDIAEFYPSYLAARDHEQQRAFRFVLDHFKGSKSRSYYHEELPIQMEWPETGESSKFELSGDCRFFANLRTRDRANFLGLLYAVKSETTQHLTPLSSTPWTYRPPFASLVDRRIFEATSCSFYTYSRDRASPPKGVAIWDFHENQITAMDLQGSLHQKSDAELAKWPSPLGDANLYNQKLTFHRRDENDNEIKTFLTLSYRRKSDDGFWKSLFRSHQNQIASMSLIYIAEGEGCAELGGLDPALVFQGLSFIYKTRGGLE